MQRLLVACVLSVVSVGCARQASPLADAEACAVNDDMRGQALKLSWDVFDQRSTDPVSFRAIANRGCKREAGELVLHYLAHKEGLDESQRRLSRFHAGQLLAEAGEEARALELIRSAYAPEQPVHSPLDWNTYVAGIVAFLEKDRTALTSARERLERVGGNNLINARVLRRMQTCFEKRYAEIWTSQCEAQPPHPR